MSEQSQTLQITFVYPLHQFHERLRDSRNLGEEPVE